MARSLRLPMMLAFALCLAPAWQVAASVPLDTLLAEADAARTADPVRFDQLLEQIDGSIATASASQRSKARLLHAHRMISSGRSIEAARELKSIVEGEGDPAVRHMASFMLANTYAITRQFEDALRMIEVTRSLQDVVTDPVARHRGMAAAAIVYNQVNEYALGEEFALQVLADHPDGRNRCLAEDLVVEARLGLGTAVGTGDAERAIELCDAQGEPMLAAFARTYLARLLHTQGRTREAIRVLERFMPQVEATGYPVIIGQFHSMLGEFRLSEGRDALAAVHADKAIEILAPVASSQPLVSAYLTTHVLADRRGDTHGALAAYRLYAEADKAHFSDMKSREMAYQVVHHQALQQAQQIELLNQRNELLELQKNITEQRAQAWLLLALLLVALLASISYWAYKTKKLQMRLRRMAEVDMLTGISNRYHFGVRAEHVLEQARRSGQRVALVMFDLDLFKQVNDRFGHDTGDWALKQVAEASVQLCGPSDCLARMGGEEFAMLLPGRDATAATKIAADVLAGIERIDTAPRGGFGLSASFGITCSVLSGYDLTRLFSDSDRAMYVAKRAGRGRASVFVPDHDDNVALFPIGHDDAGRAMRTRQEDTAGSAHDRGRASGV